MQIPVINGIYADQAGRFRTSYPRNMVPVPKQTGISQGYFQPGAGIELHSVGPGVDRGGYNWRGVCYRVMGSQLVRVDSDGTVTQLGDVGEGGQVSIDEGFECMAIWSGGRLYYWDGGSLAQVTDPDLGTAIDGVWLGGYFLSTDGESIIATELNDRTSVNPLKYGSSEVDPDPVLALDKLSNELIALNRYSIEAFTNVGGAGFPFARIDGAQVSKGVIGTHAYAKFADTIAFVGSGRNEPPAVYLMGPGRALPISTREIDTILQRYTEEQLAQIVCETRTNQGHEHLMIHLPDHCLVYDAAASKVTGEPVWFTLDSGVEAPSTYRARNHVWCYDRWLCGDPTSNNVGRLVDDVSTHYGEDIGWQFGTLVVYNDGRGAIFHELELVALPGRVQFGADPVIWTSYSEDGETWSQERATSAGKQGERGKRIVWRKLGRMRNYRIQRFRGTSDAHVAFARLEARVEPLNA